MSQRERPTRTKQASDEDELDLAAALSMAQHQSSPLALDGEDEMDDDSEDGYLPEPPPYGDEDDEDPDISDLNDPNVDTFGEPPLLGGRTQTSDMFGASADTVGRATSPKLYASASNFPSAVQFRVWRWENGIPVALGAIDAEASEDDFVKQFYRAMPQDGDGRFQFKFRPVDMNGRELGKEFTKNISEHHTAVLRIRQRERREQEERGVSQNEPILINQGGDSGGAYAEEMGRMFEHAVESAERRTELLQGTLEDEVARRRDEEKARYQERIGIADRSADVVQKMTERLMETDKMRSQEQLKSQEGQSNMLVQTLTTVFSQQQQSASAQADRLRQSDEARMRQDREFFERQRVEVEMKRKSDQSEFEMRRTREREEAERTRQKEKEEAENRLLIERERLGLEQTRIEESRKFELENARIEAERREKDSERRRAAEREEMQRREEGVKLEAQRRESELDRRRESEKSEVTVRLEREKMEVERKESRAREERERWRVEIEEKRRAEREDWDRKMSQQKEDTERRERTDRERVERERQDFQLRMEREKQEREEVANRRLEQSRSDDERRKDEARRAEDSRRGEIDMKLKQMELDAKRGQDHQERMAEQARLDREARESAQERRDRLEREGRESSDRDRLRQHEMQMKSMEMERENAREHQERLLALSPNGGGDSGGLLGGLGGMAEALGMDGTEILAKLFGAKDSEEGGWADAIPKVLGSIAELGKAALTAKAEQQPTATGRRRIVSAPPQGQIVQTPQGPMMVMPSGARGIPDQAPPRVQRATLPDQPFLPPEFASEEKQDETEEGSKPAEAVTSTPEKPVDLLARAKAAGLSLLDQKKARKAIRKLSDKLSKTEQSEWLGLITEAITSEVGIYYYIKAVTVTAALGEATDDDDLQEQVVAAMQESGLIPADVPYTEEDLALLQSVDAGGEA